MDVAGARDRSPPRAAFSVRPLVRLLEDTGWPLGRRVPGCDGLGAEHARARALRVESVPSPVSGGRHRRTPFSLACGHARVLSPEDVHVDPVVRRSAQRRLGFAAQRPGKRSLSEHARAAFVRRLHGRDLSSPLELAASSRRPVRNGSIGASRRLDVAAPLGLVRDRAGRPGFPRNSRVARLLLHGRSTRERTACSRRWS